LLTNLDFLLNINKDLSCLAYKVVNFEMTLTLKNIVLLKCLYSLYMKD